MPHKIRWSNYPITLFHSFIHQWLYSPLLGPGFFFTFVIIFTQTVGLLGRWISTSQGRYLRTGQYKHRINASTDIPASTGIGTHDPRVRGSDDISCLRPRCHSDRRCFRYRDRKLGVCKDLELCDPANNPPRGTEKNYGTTWSGYYRVQKDPSLDSILSQTNPVHTPHALFL
jgi:hypothetical protein